MLGTADTELLLQIVTLTHLCQLAYMEPKEREAIEKAVDDSDVTADKALREEFKEGIEDYTVTI